VNEASPALTRILKQVREITAAVEKARESMVLFTKPLGLNITIGETDRLAASWADVAKNAGAAQLAIGRAARTALPLTAQTAVGGGGRGRAPSWPGRHGGGGGGMHITGPSAAIPGGGHLSFRPRGAGTAAMLATGALGYGAYQAALIEDGTVMMAQHAGVDWKENRDRFRKILQDAMSGPVSVSMTCRWLRSRNCACSATPAAPTA
jgi:hypothetical protein